MDGPELLPAVTGVASTPTAANVPAAGTGGEASMPALDAFSRQAGPDVTIGKPPSMVTVHAVFEVDPVTRELRCSVVDGNGRLVRLIPPESVAAMLTAMAAYRGR